MSDGNKPLLRALAGEVLHRPPIWLMRQAGRYLPEYRRVRAEAGSFLDLCYTPSAAAEVTLQPVRRFGMDAAILFSDILVIPHALGQQVDFVEGTGPVLAPLRDAAAVLRLGKPDDLTKLAPVLETVERVRAGLPATAALIGFAGAPWTVATYMVEGGSTKEFSEIKKFFLRDSEAFQVLIDNLVEATAAYLIAQVEHGAEVLQIFDTHAGVLDEAAFQRWVEEPTAAIVARVRQRFPAVPIIGFPRGSGSAYPRYAEATGVTAVGLDTAVPLGWARENLQARWPIQGNLDPVYLLTGGPGMLAAADRILSAWRAGPFVFNLGHGIHKDTPPQHVAALIAHLRAG
ncbi:MAG: uroporphyrinogen decarboxylase [Alphaproteobacteria bacterium]